jgi:protein-S-isoprenylcysteine O-methyltransferase Ste14
MKKYQLKILIPVVYMLVSVGLFYVLLQNSPSFLQIFGMVLALGAFILWIVARIQLADNFSIGAQAHKLVTTGLYVKLRHPVYYFSILALLGIILAVGNYYLLIALLLLVVVEISRIKAEEKVLSKKFGAAYEEYKQKSWL